MTSENLSVSGFLETIKPGVATQQLFKGCCASLFLFLMCQNMKQYQLDEGTKCSYPNLNMHIRKRKKIMSIISSTNTLKLVILDFQVKFMKNVIRPCYSNIMSWMQGIEACSVHFFVSNTYIWGEYNKIQYKANTNHINSSTEPMA